MINNLNEQIKIAYLSKNYNEVINLWESVLFKKHRLIQNYFSFKGNDRNLYKSVVESYLRQKKYRECIKVTNKIIKFLELKQNRHFDVKSDLIYFYDVKITNLLWLKSRLRLYFTIIHYQKLQEYHKHNDIRNALEVYYLKRFVKIYNFLFYTNLLLFLFQIILYNVFNFDLLFNKYGYIYLSLMAILVVVNTLFYKKINNKIAQSNLSLKETSNNMT